MNELTQLQYRILNSLYFSESFANIVEEAEQPNPIVVDELRTMIDRGWVQVMEYDEEKADYSKSAIYDTDNLDQYYFLATNKGISLHEKSDRKLTN